ncbi:MAG TPA: type IV pilus assembly protein PilM [Candidatus Paceibacterota bacterium]
MSIFSIPQGLHIPESLSFLFKESGILGIDIGSSSIKVVQLKKEKERATLETYGELSLARYARGGEGRGSVVLVQEKLQQALGDVLRESQAKASRAVVSLPLRNSFVTVMPMPELSQKELKNAVLYEARKYIPIPLAEATIDWWVLPPQATDTESTGLGSPKRPFITVLLVAVPNDVIDQYQKLLSSVNVKLEAFEIESFALARAAAHAEAGTVIVVDMGATSTKVAIVDGGVVRAAHSISQGAWGLTQALQQSLGLDFERAEMLKREFGIIRRPETQGAVSVLEPLVDAIALETERFILEWKRNGGRGISRAVLAGGGALLRGVDDIFVKKLGVEVIIANPFSRVMYPAFLEPSLKEIGSVFGNAVGLALRGF